MDAHAGRREQSFEIVKSQVQVKYIYLSAGEELKNNITFNISTQVTTSHEQSSVIDFLYY
jgi:hypothetical protein